MVSTYDDWDDYRDFCDSLKIKPKDDFYKHQQEILNELGFENLYEYYQNLRTIELRDEKINQILD
jgi:hypothetical protein